MLGVLSLDTRFPRIPGDAGAPESYAVPTIMRVVDGADSPAIVRDGGPSAEIAARFVAAAEELDAAGVAAIVSTCGFLAPLQHAVARSVRAPVLLSALSLFPTLQLVRPGRIGVFTAARRALGPETRRAAGVDPETSVVVGFEDVPAFATAFLAPRARQVETLDVAAIEAAVVARASTLVASQPDLTAFLFECGNLPPYAPAVRRATGLPVFTLIDAAEMLVAASANRSTPTPP